MPMTRRNEDGFVERLLAQQLLAVLPERKAEGIAELMSNPVSANDDPILSEAFVSAARQGLNLALCFLTEKCNIDVNYVSKQHGTALMAAVINNHKGTAQILLLTRGVATYIEASLGSDKEVTAMSIALSCAKTQGKEYDKIVILILLFSPNISVTGYYKNYADVLDRVLPVYVAQSIQCFDSLTLANITPSDELIGALRHKLTKQIGLNSRCRALWNDAFTKWWNSKQDYLLVRFWKGNPVQNIPEGVLFKKANVTATSESVKSFA